MSKLRFTNKAVGDLTSIWNYTVRTWSVQQAERYYNMLMNACGSLTEPSPDICRHYDDIMTGLLGLKTGRHIIFHTISESGDVTIIRILHERMDVRQRFR